MSLFKKCPECDEFLKLKRIGELTFKDIYYCPNGSCNYLEEVNQ